MNELKLALDWTPNINHIGFFVAKELGLYEDEGINLKIIHPGQDNYSTTPAKKVEMGEADLALCPLESLLSYRVKSNPFDLRAIGCVFQEDVSAIVVKSDSEIKRPKDLDAKAYASYKARYEDHIVKELIKNDGGTGAIEITYPEKLGIWETILSGMYHATWIFENWEGVEALQKGIELRSFKLKEYDVPYSYSPVIAASQLQLGANKTLFKSFMKASKKGFMHCIKSPQESTKILSEHLVPQDKHMNIEACLEFSIPYFGTKENWGVLNQEEVQKFLDWLVEKGIEKRQFTASEIVSEL